MKKIFAFLLTATLVLSMFVVTSSADDAVNFEEDIPYVEVAPEIDGVISPAEYGTTLPQHSFNANPEQFKTEFDQYGDWDVEFYSAWDDDNLYLAWKVIHGGHIGYMPENDFNNDGKFDKDDYGYMWTYTCVQFLLTPGDPTNGTDYTTNQNYLEAGLCLTESGTTARTIWYAPTGVDKSDLDINKWNAVIQENEDDIVYEVAIPKELCSLPTFGTGAKFGLTYAVGAQEDFNSKNGMLEWQDACLGNNGVKVPQNAAIVTFTGGDGAVDIYDQLQPGELPEEATAEGIANITFNRVNFKVGDGECNLITDFEMNFNGANSFNALLTPVEGEENTFEVAEVYEAPGFEPEWTIDIPEGSFIVVANAGTGEVATDNYLAAAATLIQGSTVKLFGYDVANSKQLYTNVTLYSTEVVDIPVPGAPSDEPSDAPADEPGDDTSDDADVSDDADASDDADDADEPSDASDFNGESSDDDGNSKGGNTTLIITICVCGAIVVAIAVVVIIVLKKKKN